MGLNVKAKKKNSLFRSLKCKQRERDGRKDKKQYLITRS